MKSLCSMLIVLGLAPAQAKDGPKLDFEFHEAAQRGSASMPEMLKRLRAAVPDLDKPIEKSRLYFAEIFTLASQNANGREAEQLAQILLAIPAHSFVFDQCFDVYATRKLREMTAKLAQSLAHLDWKPTTKEVPPELVDAPRKFQEAWKLYQTVMEPLRTVMAEPKSAVARRTSPDPLQVDLRRVLGRPEPGAWKCLLAQDWSGGCLTGSESVFAPRNRALLISFLADGKLHEAAGAALIQVPDIYTTGDAKAFDPEPILKALGLDWEQVLFGLVLSSMGHNANGEVYIMSGFTGCDGWRTLAVRGSESSLHECLELIRWAKPNIESVGAFVEPLLNARPASASETMKVRTVQVSPGVRSEILSVLKEYLAPTNGPAKLLQAMQIVSSDCVKDLSEPLSALLAHRVHAVAAKALTMLDLAGLTDGKEVIAPSAPPFAVRLLLNGQPLRQTRVAVKVLATRALDEKDVPDQDGVEFALHQSNQQTLETNQEGECRITLEQCLEPERIAALQFTVSEGKRASGSLIPGLGGPDSPSPNTPPPENEWSGPWIHQRTEAQAGNDRVQEIDVRAADLEVKLDAAVRIAPGTPMHIELYQAEASVARWLQPAIAEVVVSVGGSGYFRRLQSGRYMLRVRTPMAARYDSPEIVVGEQAVVHEVELQRGRSVRGRVLFPSGVKSSLLRAAKLFRDGVEMPAERGEEDAWTGIHPGHFTVHIPSTSEWEEKARSSFPPMTEKVEKKYRVSGREVRFVIDARSPATLDLGTIKLSREK